MKKFASFLLAALLVIMTFPMIMTGASAAELSAADQAAVAAGNVAKVGDAYFTTIADAIKACADGGTVYVIADYTSTRETWALEGKDVTVDFQGFTLTNEAEAKSGRAINVNAFGTTYMNAGKTGNEDPANASEVVVKNGTIKTVNGAAVQLYNYMTLTLDNFKFDCDNVDYGSVIACGYSTVNVTNGSHIDTGYESAVNSNSPGVGLRAHSAYVTFNITDSTITSDGGIIKYGSGGVATTIKNSILDSRYQNAFINAEGTCTLTAEDSTIISYSVANNDKQEDGSLKDMAAIMMMGNGNKTTFTNCKVIAKNMDVNSCIVNSNAANKAGLSFTAYNTEFIGEGGRGFFFGGDIDVNIYGGSLVCDGRALIAATATVAEGKEQARIAINGTKITTNMADVAADAFVGTNPLSGAVMVSGCASVDFNNVEFTANCADGVTPWADSPIIVAWAGAKDKVNVNGGKYVGGSAFLVRYAFSGDTEAPFDAANSVVYSYAEGKDSAVLSPEVAMGASIRTADKSGIRFSTNISADAIEFAKASGADVSFGTVIVPVDYLDDIKFITIEGLEAAGKKYLDIKADAGIIENADGSVTINAAMIDILAANYDREFVATAYIKYTVDEVDYYIWANPSIENNARSIEAVAYAALADVTTTATDAYTTAVTEYYVYENGAYKLVTGTAYSRYNAAQIAAIKAYIA